MTNVSQLTTEEMVESLTGYEEMAIAKHFGADVSDLLENKPTMGLRSLVFVHCARDEGVKADSAKKVAMEMTLRNVQGYFRDGSTEEVDPADLETETGKGELLST